MTMCVWCIPKIRLKSIFDIQSKSEKIGTKKGVFIKKDKVGTFRGHFEDKHIKISKGYQSGIKRLSKRYQKVIKAVSKGYQSGINRNT